MEHTIGLKGNMVATMDAINRILVLACKACVLIFVVAQIIGTLWYGNSSSLSSVLVGLASVFIGLYVIFSPASWIVPRGGYFIYIIFCFFGMLLSIYGFRSYWLYSSMSLRSLFEHLVYPLSFILLGILSYFRCKK